MIPGEARDLSALQIAAAKAASRVEGFVYFGTFCTVCGNARKVESGICDGCGSRLRSIREARKSAASWVEFDRAIGDMEAATRRTEIASERLHKAQRVSGASVQSFLAARPVALTPEGRREAAALGLVNIKTSDTQQVSGRLTIEIDPLQQRANRLKHSVITSARLHDQEAKAGAFRGAWYFLTLTYREGSDSSPRDVSELLKRMRGHFNRTRAGRSRWQRESFRYVWVGELTQRLRPHYHIMLWVPKGMYFGKVDQRGWWPHGSTQIEKARNCVGYLAKYASKFTPFTAGAFPKGFRTHGVGGLNAESRRELRWWKAAKEAREALGADADIRKCKGGWFDRLTGEFWPSPWKVTFIFGRTVAWKVITYEGTSSLH